MAKTQSTEPSKKDKIAVDRDVKNNGSNPINIHKSANGSSNVIGWLAVGKTSTATFKKNGYYYITPENGWVSAAQVKVTNHRDENVLTYTSPEEEAKKAEKKAKKEAQAARTISKDDQGYKTYMEYINVAYDENALANAVDDLIVDNLSGVYGIPYQFPASVDPKLSLGDGKTSPFGRIYADRVISRIPLLMMSPGKVDFMKNASDGEKLPVIESLFGDGSGAGTISDFLSNPVKYYTFTYDAPQYWEYVNTMNSACATFLGIQDVKISINGYSAKLRNFKWEKATNNKFDTFLISNQEYVCFYCDAQSSTKSEDFSNSTTESQLASKVNSFSDTAKELSFILGGTTGSALAKIVDPDKITAITNKIDDIAEGLLGGSQIFKNLGNDFAVIATGGKLIFPEIWSDSEFSQSFDVNFKFRCPCPNPIQWFLDIIVPLNHLIAFTLPRSPRGSNILGEDFGNMANGYMTPFLVRAFYKGLFNCDMGIVTSLSIQKGKEGSWTLNGLPSEVDVSMTIKDLYNIMVMTSDTMPATFLSNTCFLNYLANSCGININKPDLERSIDLYYTVYSKKLTRAITGYGFWKNLEQNVKNKLLDWTSSIF